MKRQLLFLLIIFIASGNVVLAVNKPKKAAKSRISRKNSTTVYTNALQTGSNKKKKVKGTSTSNRFAVLDALVEEDQADQPELQSASETVEANNINTNAPSLGSEKNQALSEQAQENKVQGSDINDVSINFTENLKERENGISGLGGDQSEVLGAVVEEDKASQSELQLASETVEAYNVNTNCDLQSSDSERDRRANEEERRQAESGLSAVINCAEGSIKKGLRSQQLNKENNIKIDSYLISDPNRMRFLFWLSSCSGVSFITYKLLASSKIQFSKNTSYSGQLKGGITKGYIWIKKLIVSKMKLITGRQDAHDEIGNQF